MIVIKVGGSEGIDYDAVCDDVAELLDAGQQLVLIHGGSHLTNQVATALGHPPQFVTSPSGYSSRLTDRAALEIFEMVYCGQVNKNIVERLQRRGINSVGKRPKAHHPRHPYGTCGAGKQDFVMGLDAGRIAARSDTASRQL
jgi:acetylglutamate/LysW-gamma-L-alpha-aminoadipate kinase